MDKPTYRVQKLREHALDKKVLGISSDEWQLLYHRSYLDNYNSSSMMVRRATAKAYMLGNSTPIIDEYELIVGKPNYRELTKAEQNERNQQEFALKAAPMLAGQGSHMAIDYEKLLKLGIVGIKAEIVEYKSKLDLNLKEDIAKDEFYKGTLIALYGLTKYAHSYSQHAKLMADACTDDKRKKELMDIATVCKKVPFYPATTFAEALQSVHFVTFCLEGLYQLGRVDRYLIDFYRKDILEGVISIDKAQELIDCLCILYNEYINRGLAVGLMVGGADEFGLDVTNELTYMFIKSIGHTRMIYPGIGLCYTKDTPKDLLELSCKLLSGGLSHPALFNDDVITKGLLAYGLPIEDACLYIHSTCVEITPIAASAVWVASPYINLLQLLLDVMDENNEVSSFEDIIDNYKKRLSQKVAKEAHNENLIQMERYNHGGDPLVSCFVKDCLKEGRDVDQGGARYNWIMPSFVGLANLADSFMAIKKLVFVEREMTLGEFKGILNDNYKGSEGLRQRILNRVPKYGNDIDEVDDLISEISGWIIEETGKHTTFRGDKFIPSLFCWIMHEQLGGETMATPDGRTAGFPLGDGSGPAQGREQMGPTASILSSTKWDHSPFIGGIAVNMKFGKRFFDDKSMDKMLDLIHTFMSRGGFELQINVVNKDVLIKARENSEQYRDLIVRVGGYSDYFVHLSKSMQDEVIMRSWHSC